MTLRLRILVGAVAALAMASCGSGDGSGSGYASGGKLNVLVTDAPFPSQYVASATVVIKEVRVQDAASGGWTTVFEGSEPIDLVPLVGGVTELLASADLPPGTYDQVRLIVEGGTVVLTDDAMVRTGDHTFTMANGGLLFPSGPQTGIKVNIDVPIEVTTTLSADLVLDFDLARNFVLNGSPEHAPGVSRVLFTPVVRAVNSTTSGRITFDVLSDAGTPGDTSDDAPLPGANVTATDADGAEAGTAAADADGHVVLILPAGTYSLLVEATGHASATLTDVTVTLANETALAPVTLAATASMNGTVLSDAGTAGDTSDDVAIEGATVSAALQGSGDPPATATTATDGTWQIAGLAPGTYDVTFEATGHDTQTVTGVTLTTTATTVDVTLVKTP